MRRLPSTTALKAFEAVARLGSVTLAAEELYLTQSAVSRQIRGLEDMLGIPLFEVVRQRIVLTQSGRRYSEEIRPILARLSSSSLRAMASAKGIQLIEMATLPTFCCRWLIPRLPKFYAQHTDASINFTSKFEPFSFDVELFDLAIHFGRPDWPEAKMMHLFNEHVVATCSPSFRETHHLETDDDIVRAPLLHLDLRATAWKEWCDRFAEGTENIYRGMRYDQFSMLTEAAMAGLGVALLPEILIEDELRTGRLVIVSDSLMDTDDGYFIAVPENKPTPAIVEALCDWMLEEAKTASASGLAAEWNGG